MKYTISILILLTTAFFPLILGNYFHPLIPFNNSYYYKSFHHFIHDTRITSGKFNIVNAIAQADSQWYLKIASHGYPKNPNISTLRNKDDMGSLSYAFFPIYPLLIHFLNIPIQNIEMSAFTLMIILLVINVFTLQKLYGFKTTFAVFTFPFSIFLRSYYAESLLLLLLALLTHYLSKQRYHISAALIALMSITKGTIWLLIPIFWIQILKLNIAYIKKAQLIFYSSSGIIIWMTYCLIQTGNPFYFLYIRKAWETSNIFPLSTLNIFGLFLNIDKLPWHWFEYSVIENLTAMFFITILIKIFQKNRPNKWVSLSILALPLTRTSLLSFSRFQSINIPLFSYISSLKKVKYLFITFTFVIGLSITTLYFFNWYWIG